MPLAIGILPIEMSDAVAAPESGLALPYDASEMRDRLVAVLDDLTTSTSIQAVEPDVEVFDFDLLVRPRIRRVSLGYEGATQGAVLSSLLWITTWVGGLFLDDAEYNADVDLEWDLVLPDSSRAVDVLETRSGRFELDFLDRNALLSWASLQSLVVPPVLTSDSTLRTSQALADRALAVSGAGLARYLKSGMDGLQRDVLGQLRLDSPRNGERIAAEDVDLRGRFFAGSIIRSLSIYRNDDAEPVISLEGDDMPAESAQRLGRTYQVRLPETRIPLDVGENRLRFYATFGGTDQVAQTDASRTVKVIRITRAKP